MTRGPKNTEFARPQRREILLIEDDAGVRRSIHLLLQAHGYNVRSYATGDSLLSDPAIYQAFCLVADYRMDGMDGLAVLSALRAQGWMSPAILITAYPSADFIQASAQDGVELILTKPFVENELVNAIRSVEARVTTPRR